MCARIQVAQRMRDRQPEDACTPSSCGWTMRRLPMDPGHGCHSGWGTAWPAAGRPAAAGTSRTWPSSWNQVRLLCAARRTRRGESICVVDENRPPPAAAGKTTVRTPAPCWCPSGVMKLLRRLSTKPPAPWSRSTAPAPARPAPGCSVPDSPGSPDPPAEPLPEPLLAQPQVPSDATRHQLGNLNSRQAHTARVDQIRGTIVPWRSMQGADWDLSGTHPILCALVCRAASDRRP